MSEAVRTNPGPSRTGVELGNDFWGPDEFCSSDGLSSQSEGAMLNRLSKLLVKAGTEWCWPSLQRLSADDSIEYVICYLSHPQSSTQ